MGLMTWDAWHRSDACKSLTDHTYFAGTSLAAILYQAMRKLFLDEQGNYGLVYTGQLMRAARLIRATDGWNRWGYAEADMKRMLKDGLYDFGSIFESSTLKIDVDTSPSTYGNANLCSFLGNANTINLNFGILQSIALGNYVPGMPPFPQDASGIGLYCDLMAGEIMHELMHTQGFHHQPDKGKADESFGSVYFLSLPHLAKLSALGAGGNWWWFRLSSYLFGGSFYDALSGLNFFNTVDVPRWSPYQGMDGAVYEPSAAIIRQDPVTAFPALIDVYARTTPPAGAAPPIRIAHYLTQRWFDSTLPSPSTVQPKNGWADHRAASDIAIDSGATVVSWNEKHRIVFANSKGKVMHKYWLDGTWSQWVDCGMAGAQGEIGAVGIAGNSIELYIRGADNHLWQGDFKGLDQPFHWHKLDDQVLVSPPAAISLRATSRHVFSQNAHEVCYKAWTAEQGWLPWVGIGGKCVGRVGVVGLQDNSSIEVYARGLDNLLWQCTWNGDAWGGWFPHNDGVAMTSSPSVVSSRMDLRQLFFTNDHQQVVCKKFEAPF